LEHFLFLFLFLSISFKLLSSIFFFPTSFLLNHLWGIIFHAWWSTLVLWFLYLSSYIKNLIFCSIWSNLSICCFSSISFRFRSRGGSNYQFQSLIQFYQFYPRLFQVKIYLYSLSWCVPESTTHLGCFVIPNWPHTSISFFDYMCSWIDHTLVKEGQMYAPKNGHLDYGPPLFNLSIYQIFWINGL
jgi:hypothetical protein